jgi:hypothetical protein
VFLPQNLPKHEKLTELKEEIDNSTLVVEGFNKLLSTIVEQVNRRHE